VAAIGAVLGALLTWHLAPGVARRQELGRRRDAARHAIAEAAARARSEMVSHRAHALRGQFPGSVTPEKTGEALTRVVLAHRAGLGSRHRRRVDHAIRALVGEFHVIFVELESTAGPDADRVALAFNTLALRHGWKTVPEMPTDPELWRGLIGSNLMSHPEAKEWEQIDRALSKLERLR
jgi:hypothetical protein